MESRSEYLNNWQRENKERINLTVPKGKKELIVKAAAANGESTTAYINRLISEDLEKHPVD